MYMYIEPITGRLATMGFPSATLESMICENKRGRDMIVSRIVRRLRGRDPK